MRTQEETMVFLVPVSGGVKTARGGLARIEKDIQAKHGKSIAEYFEEKHRQEEEKQKIRREQARERRRQQLEKVASYFKTSPKKARRPSATSVETDEGWEQPVRWEHPVRWEQPVRWGQQTDDDTISVVTGLTRMRSISNGITQIETLERRDIRLGGLEPSIVITIFVAQLAFESIAATKPDWESISRCSTLQEVLQVVDLYSAGVFVASSVSVVCGLYAIVVQTLIMMHGKQYLGNSQDRQFSLFMDKIKPQEQRALLAFKVGLCLFALSVAMLVCLHSPKPLRHPVALLFASIFPFGWREYRLLTEEIAPKKV